MGRKNNRRFKKGRNKKSNYDSNDNQNANGQAPYREDFTEKTIDQGNFKMEAYYALQGMHDHSYASNELVPCATAEEKNAERLKWRTSVSTILPASFRTAYDIPEDQKERMETELEELITEQKKEAAAAAKLLAKEKDDTEVAASTATAAFETAAAEKADQKEIMKKIPFLPHAYQLFTDRKTIRKDASMKKLHLWLRRQTDAGFITRQETVSMLPPVVMNPRPNDLVLDMCAAPGSKTCQILEKLGVGGAMVANDSSSQRAYMLVHQLRRIMHNNPAVLVTSCDAQFFPQQNLMFDRILADVPCSGDGTSRKNIGIWKNWNQLGALALHALQLDIAWKGIALLKVGGYMCYSTCSHNPIENEAVVAELLRRSEGSLELVDAPLEGFKVRPGLQTWKVLAEEKSNRQKKSEKKKNNAKMQQRRAEWDQKEVKAKGSGEDANGDDAMDATEEEAAADTNATEEETAADTANTEEEAASVTTATEEEAAADTTAPESNDKEEEAAADDKDENGKKEEYSRPRFVPPASWDEETLIALAKESGLVHYKTVEDVPMNLQKRIKQTCFPPATKEELEKFHLEKCIRCLSHDNDTGGFFVALLKKVAPTSRREVKESRRSAEGAETVDASEDGPEPKKMKPNPEPVAEEKVADTSTTTNEGEKDEETLADAGEKQARPLKQKLLGGGKGKKHNDLGKDDFVRLDPSLFDPLIEFYGFTDSFPKEQIMTRAGGDAKVLHYLAKSVKDNFIDRGIQERITIIGSGVKGFVRNTNLDSETPYRISQEGVHFLLPHMTKRKLVASLEDFAMCMTGEGKVIPLSNFSEDFIAAASALSSGPLVCVLKGYTDYTKKLVLVMWRCRTENVNCLVSKAEIEAMTIKLGALKTEEKVEVS